MSHTPFDIVDFLLCEIKESIADGLKAGRQQPYTHIINYLLDRTIVQHLQNLVRHPLADSPTFYKVYNPPSSRDTRRGQKSEKQINRKMMLLRIWMPLMGFGMATMAPTRQTRTTQLQPHLLELSMQRQVVPVQLSQIQHQPKL